MSCRSCTCNSCNCPFSSCNCPFQEIRAEDGQVSSEELHCILDDAVQRVTFDNDEMLFMQGRPSTNLFAITDGMVKICTHTTEGREQIVGLSSPERLLVGLQSVNEDRYAYTAIAATPVKACKINHRTLLSKVRNKGDLAMRMIQAVNAQLAHSRALMEILGHKCAAAKVASFILLMTPKSEQGDGPFTLPFSRMEMAGLLGLSEETVCRLMASMKRAGAIYAPRGKVEIRDWDQLHAIADGGASPPDVSTEPATARLRSLPLE